MPLDGYTCPAGTPTAGQRNQGLTHCTTPASDGGCPHKCVSPPLLIAMWNAEHSNHHVGNYLSASSLSSTSCARQTWFERYFAFYETPRRRFWPFRGTICHALIEGSDEVAAKLGWMQELRMKVELSFRDLPAPTFDENGAWTGDFDSTQHLKITLGGTCDAFNVIQHELHDYKTLSDLKVAGFLAGKDGGQWSKNIKDSWVMQTNIYAWMLGQTPVANVLPWFEKHGLTPPRTTFLPKPKRLSMQLVSMMEIPLTGTNYVPLRSAEPYWVDDVPVLSDEEVEAFVREQALKWFRWLVLRQKPPVVERKNKWMCKGCQFNGEIIFGERCMPEAERKAEEVNEGAFEPAAEPEPAPLTIVPAGPRGNPAAIEAASQIDDPYGFNAPAKKTRKKKAA